MAAAGVWQKLPGSHPKSLSVRIKRFLHTASSSGVSRYLTMTALFQNEQWLALFAGDPPPLSAASLPQMLALGDSFLANRDLVQTALALDRITYLPGDLLTKVDRASMLHALEVRSPFMDPELVQFAAGLTTGELLGGGSKRMLREAFAPDLPAWVFKRRKMGFAVPIGEWFRGELRPMLRDHLFAADSFASSHFSRATLERLADEHERRRADHSQRLYALLMLELWWKNSKV